jgi:hypothetical protein
MTTQRDPRHKRLFSRSGICKLRISPSLPPAEQKNANETSQWSSLRRDTCTSRLRRIQWWLDEYANDADHSNRANDADRHGSQYHNSTNVSVRGCRQHGHI